VTTLSTHVLDAALGRPATGLEVTLDDTVTATTDGDGRIRFDAPVDPGVHELVFATGPWFAQQDRATFHPLVRVAFEATEGEHHHVALLLSPFAYTTYRGS
jgi:5-hydroxyisourate hydrolase